jgi:ABC-2 type transport system ATP-binding protein
VTVDALALAGVTKRWGALTVLDNVDLTVPPGTIARVAGDNGTGKTTLLRIVTGTVAPEAGSVTVAGFHLRRDRRAYHESLGFLAAGDRGLYARLTVRDNLDFAAGICFLRGARRRESVADAIDRFGLRTLERQRVDRLSMGQRQRVRIAIALLHAPRLVLLDEPRTSLDEAGLEVLVDALDGFVAAGGSVVWVSPTGDDPCLPFDRAYVLEDGKLRPW